MGLPAIVAGFALVGGHGLLETAQGFGGAVMLLAALAGAGTWLGRSTQPSPAKA
jgi:hypothetical protein